MIYAHKFLTCSIGYFCVCGRYPCATQHNFRKERSVISSEAASLTKVNGGVDCPGGCGGGYGYNFVDRASGRNGNVGAPSPPSTNQLHHPHQVSIINSAGSGGDGRGGMIPPSISQHVNEKYNGHGTTFPSSMERDENNHSNSNSFSADKF